MKIIFNHTINDWWGQIYDEWNRNYEVILPEYYEKNNYTEESVDLDSLEEIVKKNLDASFIFGFHGDLSDLIKWQSRKIKIPLINCFTNATSRPHIGKMSAFMKVWYVEQYAKPLMEKYYRENLIYAGMAANPFIFYPVKLDKIFDISFIGRHYGERGYYLNKIQKFSKNNDINFYFPLGNGSKMYFNQMEINNIYNKTNINIAFAPKEKTGRIVNLRTFEICMSGNFQLLQFTPCIEEYFEIDEEIVCWKNTKDLYNKILYFLENEDEREKIAHNGYKRAIENHTWTKRLELIGSIFNKKEQLNISKRKTRIKLILDEIKDFQRKSEDSNYDVLKQILKNYNYRKRDLKKIDSIKINLWNKAFIYKPDLRNFYFVKFYGKTMMIIRIINTSELNDDEWVKLKKIQCLYENPDTSLIHFGVLTNGIEWVIRDFKNQKWLNTIPNRKEMKSYLRAIEHLKLVIMILLKKSSYLLERYFSKKMNKRIKIFKKRFSFRLYLNWL